ncbi:MAG: Ig-like domain-containing protein [Firmicutes bacterium]|nr:Ig-like domain-containing protein [Bacillota bacterium]
MKKKGILLTLFALLLTFAVALTACDGGGDDKDVAVTGVTLNKSTITLTVGAHEDLQATVLPADATNKAVTWSVENQSESNVITVNQSGRVTANNPGTARVRVVSNADSTKFALCEVTVEAPAPQLASIAVTTQPTNLTYNFGQSFNPAGMVVTATYSDESTEVVPTESLTFKTTALNHSDTAFTITYNGQTATVTLTINAVVVGLTVTGAVTEYDFEDLFDDTMTVVAVWSNEDEETLTADEYTLNLTAGDALTHADTTLTVTYEGYSEHIPLTINAIVTGMQVTQGPVKSEYRIGESFSPVGMSIVLTFSDESTQTITDNFAAEGITFSPSTPFTHAEDEVVITVTYDTFVDDTSVLVDVIDVTLQSITVDVLPDQVEYDFGQLFNPEGMEVTAQFSDLSTEDVTAYVTFKLTALNHDDVSFTITYGSFSQDITLTINAVLLGIDVTVDDEYDFGDVFEYSNLTVTARWSDSDVVLTAGTDFTLNIADGTTLNHTHTTLVFTFDNDAYTHDNIALTVNAVLLGIDVVVVDEYDFGDVFDYATLTVTARWSDGDVVLTAGTDFTLNIADGKELDHGDTTLVFTFDDNAYTHGNITLTINAVVTGISIKSGFQLEYFVDDVFDAAGLTVIVEYSDLSTEEVVFGVGSGTEIEVDLNGETLALTDTSFTVSFGGYTINVEISVVVATTFITVTGNDTTIYTNSNPTSATFTIAKNEGSSNELDFDKQGTNLDAIQISFNAQTGEVTVTIAQGNTADADVTITVKATDGSLVEGDKTITISVRTRVMSLFFDEPTVLALIDDLVELEYTVTQGASNPDVTWEIQNERTFEGELLAEGSVLVLDALTGEITAVGFGLATVVITSVENPSRGDECEVTVANFKIFGGIVDGIDAAGERMENIQTSTTTSIQMPGRIYIVSPGDEITIVADEPPVSNTMFVGWDRNDYGYRIGDPGQGEYTFTMPSEPLTIMASFSPFSNLFVAGSTALDRAAVAGGNLFASHTQQEFGWPNNNSTATSISNGGGDPDLKGLSGISVGIPGGTPAGRHNRIRGSAMSNSTAGGSLSIEYIFKNHGDVPLTIELMGESFGGIGTTGILTVPANGVLRNMTIVANGMHNPFLILAVREAVDGGGRNRLDIVARQAATFMIFDPQVPTVGAVSFGSLNGAPASDWSASSDATRGMILVAGNQGSATVNASVTGLPALADGETVTRIYFRVVNFGAVAATQDLRLRFGTSGGNGSFGDHTITISRVNTPGDVQLFYMDLDRSTDPTNVVFTFSWTSSPFRCFSIQANYNDVFIL